VWYYHKLSVRRWEEKIIHPPRDSPRRYFYFVCFSSSNYVPCQQGHG
jgi:hypothetical protein